jgi:hypothetical protein
MDFKRRVRALEKKLAIEEPRELNIELGHGQVLRIRSDRLTELLRKIGSKDDLIPPCEARD